MRSFYQKSMKRTLVFTLHVWFASWPSRTRSCLHGLCIWVIATRHHGKSSSLCPGCCCRSIPVSSNSLPKTQQAGFLLSQDIGICENRLEKSFPAGNFPLASEVHPTCKEFYFYFFFIFQCRALCFLSSSSSPANSHQQNSVMWLPFSPAPWSWEHIHRLCVQPLPKPTRFTQALEERNSAKAEKSLCATSLWCPPSIQQRFGNNILRADTKTHTLNNSLVINL